MSWLEELELELRKAGMPVARRRRIVAEFADHLASDPGSEDRLGSPAALARQFADEVGTGYAGPAAVAVLVLLGTSVVCLWAATYQQFAPVGIVGVRYTPYWAVPMAVGVGLGGALVAALIYRQGRPAGTRGWLVLWGLLSALFLAFGSPGPWLSVGTAETGAVQHALVLVAAVGGAVVLVVLRQRRTAGLAALLTGLVGLGITLHAAAHLSGLLLYGPAGKEPNGFGGMGWELDLALFASVSLVLCGLVWVLALPRLRERAPLASATPAD